MTRTKAKAEPVKAARSKVKPAKATKRAATPAAKPETVLVLRSCNADMTSHGGFRWPESGPVEAPDWGPVAQCGRGLHGLLWGVGDANLMKWAHDARWLAVEVDAATIVDLGGKVKFPRGVVVFCGTHMDVAAYVCTHGGAGRAVVSGTSTSGYRGTSTSGYRGTSTSGDGGTSTSGDRGTSTSGYRGTSTSGDGGTSTSGDGGTSTSGYGGVIAIQYWNGKRYKVRIGHVKDEDGDGELKPNVKYRLNARYEFEEVV